MGTDIHYSYQAKNEKDEWEDLEIGQEYGSEFYIDRYYLLFSVLADVRNGFGFAGVKTYDPVIPIDTPRGLPDDILGERIDKFDFGDHSFSWLLSSEILEYYKTPQLIPMFGVVPSKVFFDWDLKTPPTSYCGDTSGPSVKVCYLPYDVKKAQQLGSENSKYTHYQIEWETDAIKDTYFFRDNIQKLQDKYGEIRIVFGFDS